MEKKAYQCPRIKVVLTDLHLLDDLSVVGGTVDGRDVLGKEFDLEEEENLFDVKIHSVWDD